MNQISSTPSEQNELTFEKVFGSLVDKNTQNSGGIGGSLQGRKVDLSPYAGGKAQKLGPEIFGITGAAAKPQTSIFAEVITTKLGADEYAHGLSKIRESKLIYAPTLEHFNKSRDPGARFKKYIDEVGSASDNKQMDPRYSEIYYLNRNGPPTLAIEVEPVTTATAKIECIEDQLPLAEVVSRSNAATSHLRELFSAAPRFLAYCVKILKSLFTPSKEVVYKLLKDAIDERGPKENKKTLDSIFASLEKHEGLEKALVGAPNFLRVEGAKDNSNRFAEALSKGKLEDELGELSKLSEKDPKEFVERAHEFCYLLKCVAKSAHSEVQANHDNLTFTESQEKFYNLALEVLMAAKGRAANDVFDGLTTADGLSNMIVCSLFGVEYLTPEGVKLNGKLIERIKVDIAWKKELEEIAWQKELEEIAWHAEQESKEIDNII